MITEEQYALLVSKRAPKISIDVSAYVRKHLTMPSRDALYSFSYEDHTISIRAPYAIAVQKVVGVFMEIYPNCAINYIKLLPTPAKHDDTCEIRTIPR